MGSLSRAALRTGQIAFALDALAERGIDSTPLANAMVGNAAAIDDLSRKLLPHALAYQAARLARERGRESKSTTGRPAGAPRQSRTLVRDDMHLPLATVGFLISLMIDACTRAGVPPPEALAELVRAYCGADTYAAREFKAPDAFDKAARYKLAYPDAKQAEIARHAGVSRPRVSQWVKDGSLDRAAERLSRLGGVAELIRSTTPRT
jgi:hypothetical protein